MKRTICIALSLLLCALCCAGPATASDGYYVIVDNCATYWIENGEARLVELIYDGNSLLELPEKVVGAPLTEIGDHAYVTHDMSSDSVVDLIIPGTVRRIGTSAFAQANKLKSVYIKEGVEEIGRHAFYSINHNIYLTLPASVTQIGENVIYSGTIYAAEGTVGLQYALDHSPQCRFVVNRTEDGLYTGVYAGFGFVTQNGEATLTRAYSLPLFPPFEIEGCPVTTIRWDVIHAYHSHTFVIPPSVTCIDSNPKPDTTSPTLLYFPYTYGETYAKKAGYPCQNVYLTLPLPYTDVKDGSWYYESACFAYYNDLMYGVAADIFGPEETMTRAMLVTVLYRLDGCQAVNAENIFVDVPEGQWYTDAVIWASEYGIVGGIGGARFAPDDTVTREQIATILYRYVKAKGYSVSASGNLAFFPDHAQVSDYAKEAMAWAVDAKLIGGRPVGTVAHLFPGDGATRAEVGTLLMRLIYTCLST